MSAAQPGCTDQKTCVAVQCGAECAARACGRNRVVSEGIQLPLEVFKTRAKGWGVRCSRAIARGAFICTYEGALVDDLTAVRRVTVSRQGLMRGCVKCWQQRLSLDKLGCASEPLSWLWAHRHMIACIQPAALRAEMMWQHCQWILEAAWHLQDARTSEENMYLFELDDFFKEHLDRRKGVSEDQYAQQRIPSVPSRLLNVYIDNIQASRTPTALGSALQYACKLADKATLTSVDSAEHIPCSLGNATSAAAEQSWHCDLQEPAHLVLDGRETGAPAAPVSC